MNASSDVASIRAIIEARTRQFHAKDVDALMAGYAPDAVVADMAPPLRTVASPAAGRRALVDWFATFTGPVGLAMDDVRIEADGGLAFAHGLVHITGDRTDGSRTDVWARGTLCFRKAGGDWKIAHEHQSVPFHMDGSLKAAIDLEA